MSSFFTQEFLLRKNPAKLLFFRQKMTPDDRSQSRKNNFPCACTPKKLTALNLLPSAFLLKKLTSNLMAMNLPLSLKSKKSSAKLNQTVNYCKKE